MPNDHLVIITPALSGGGIEKSIPILIEPLSKLVKLPVVWIGINESVFGGTLPQTTVICAGRHSKDGVLKTIKSLIQIRKYIIRLENPLLLINGEVAELFAAFFVWNRKMICVEHASQPWINSRILGRVVRFVLKIKLVRWVTVNSQQKCIWPSIKLFTHIPNPVAPTEPNSADDGFGLIHIGRLSDDKSVHVACQAAVQMQMKLDIYGEGELLSELREEFLKMGDITFHGYVEDVWSKIGPNRILVSSSRHEGDGRSIAEAIVRSQPLLLLDTLDHRRFNLPEKNYFRSLEELTTRLDPSQIQDVDWLKPSEELSEIERQNRHPSNIALLWWKFIAIE